MEKLTDAQAGVHRPDDLAGMTKTYAFPKREDAKELPKSTLATGTDLD